MYYFSIVTIKLYVLIILHASYNTVQSEISSVEFNKHFLTEYGQARAHLLSTIDPLFIFNDDTITLIHRGERTSIGLTSATNQDLKAISHIPFTIYLLLFNVQSNDNDLSSNKIAKLKSYLEDIHTLRKSLNFSHSIDDVLQTQFDIIDLSIDYLRSIIKSKYFNKKELKEFCLKSRQLFQLNIHQAACVQLDNLHLIVKSWYIKLFNETERRAAKAVITGSKSVRNGFYPFLYFRALLSVSEEQYEGNRVLYVENVYDEQKIMNVLGSWLLDEYAGDAFFDDPLRLHRDLMMDETDAPVHPHYSSKYEQARTRLLSKIDPLIISNRNNITLIYRGERTSVRIVSTINTHLKVTSHIPLTIYLILFNVQSKDYDLSSDQMAKLKSYLDNIHTLRKSLNFSHSDNDVLQIQLKLIDLSINYICSIIESKHLNQTELKEFCLKSQQLFELNLNRIAHDQLDLLHSIVNSWYTKLFNETERQAVKVVVAGPKSLREGFFTTLYFKALFGINGEHYEGDRIIFAEHVHDEPTIINVLGSRFLDEYVGDVFYDDSLRLHRDIMMDGTGLFETFIPIK